MRALGLKAYWKLISMDRCLRCGDFAAVHEKVRGFPIRSGRPSPDTVGRVLSALDMACIWYWKQVLCLQRSAATACLLREYGVRAEMVIGAQHLPFKAHAWVEVDGQVVNDKPYIPEIYAVLDRC